MLRILLFPFAVLFDLVTRVRNYRYDRDLRASVKFDLPVICVGNLTVGGTGKTPMIEHLIRLLSPASTIATLSRGYGRITRGLRIADRDDNASTIGDEPFQFFKKYGDKVKVAVGEDRAFAIPHILQEHPEVEVILLDDAFQHRRVRPSFSVLLSDYGRPFYKDPLLPAGRLRESKSGAKRADAIVITKCPPEISEEECMAIEKSVRRYADKPVFFARIHYGDPIAFGRHKGVLTEDVVLVSGIANAGPLRDYIANNFALVTHLNRPDHHVYTRADLQEIATWVGKNPAVSILTTEKDMVKLDIPLFQEYLEHLPFFYLPIEMEFLKNGEDFDAMVQNAVSRAN
ncbi:MAG TPA: tetraacyldisaccharide 4'-kinase [Ohtaekwangia sp.]|nr:tetraacyldisaccharide 4'-kinase [Ohtaekwangia sp.]